MALLDVGWFDGEGFLMLVDEGESCGQRLTEPGGDILDDDEGPWSPRSICFTISINFALDGVVAFGWFTLNLNSTRFSNLFSNRSSISIISPSPSVHISRDE